MSEQTELFDLMLKEISERKRTVGRGIITDGQNLRECQSRVSGLEFAIEHKVTGIAGNRKKLADEKSRERLFSSRLEGLETQFKAIQSEEREVLDKSQIAIQTQRDHEREMKIIDHEIARENRLAAEATAKVAATAQEQASQSIDGLLKGLQGNGEG